MVKKDFRKNLSAGAIQQKGASEKDGAAGGRAWGHVGAELFMENGVESRLLFPKFSTCL